MGCDAMPRGRNLLTFRRNGLYPSASCFLFGVLLGPEDGNFFEKLGKYYTCQTINHHSITTQKMVLASNRILISEKLHVGLQFLCYELQAICEYQLSSICASYKTGYIYFYLSAE
jgi:hypothetical protein